MVAMRQAEDIILRDFLLSAVGVYICRGGVDGDSPTEITVKDLSAVAASLDTSNGLKFLTGKIGEDKFGSSPVRPAYLLLANTELQPNLDSMQNFTSSWNYPNRDDVTESEYGAVFNTRIFTSSEAAVMRGVSRLGADVYSNMFVGRESYGHISQDGYSAQLVYRPPMYSGPLALNASLGVKFAQAQVLKQETWIRNVQCTLAM